LIGIKIYKATTKEIVVDRQVNLPEVKSQQKKEDQLSKSKIVTHHQ